MAIDESGRIVAAGTLAELRRTISAPVTEFPGAVIMPGLVNAHTHLELTHFSAWKVRKGVDYMPRTYLDWVMQVIKIRRSLTESEIEQSIREGLRISVESGVTALGDILVSRASLPVYSGVPLAGRIFFEAIGHDPLLGQQSAMALEEAVDGCCNGSMLPGLSPHAPHTLSEALHRSIKAIARTRALPTTIHLSESTYEGAFFFDSTGGIADTLYPHVGWDDYLPAPRRTTPAAWLDGIGVLDEQTLAIHCVHLNPADVEILHRRGVTIVLCPRSNARLNVGRAPVLLFKKAGIRLALGTDSLASNDSLSLWDEMRYLAHEFPDVFTADEIFRMATCDGAAALGLADMTGKLEPGKRADFLIVDCGDLSAEVDIYSRIVGQGRMMASYVNGAQVVH